MTTWRGALDSAGIVGARLRDDYTEQRRVVARYDRAAYVSARLLLPPALLPHVVAATAFMHHSDTLLDTGDSPAARAERFTAWETRLRTALAGADGTHGPHGPDGGGHVVRPLLRTIASYPHLRGCVEDYLAAAPADLHFNGFRTEEDYQRYIDEYSLPGAMLVMCLLVPESGLGIYRKGCRTLLEAMQRLDFLNDLAEDLRGGRLALPQDAMERFGVTRTALEEAQDTPGIRDLIRQQCDLARAALRDSQPLVPLTPVPQRPLIRSLIAVQGHLLDAVRAKGPGLLRASARPAVPALLGVLAGEYLRSRRTSGSDGD